MFGVTVTILAFAALLGGPALAFLRVLSPLTGLLVFAMSAPLGLVAVGYAVWAAVTRGMSTGVWVALLGVVPVLVLAVAVLPALRYPGINDITTNGADPPAFRHARTIPENRNRDMTFPEAFAAEIERAYPELKPIVVSIPPHAAYARAMQAAEAMPDWEIARRDADAMEIEAVATTRLFGFKDDIVVRVRPSGAGGSVVDVRSKSRDGKGDLGANAKRITTYKARIANEGE